MNLQETARIAAVRGLLAHWITEGAAERITRHMVAFQPDEWRRILDRAFQEDIRHLYIVVTHYDGDKFSTLLYAPIAGNNIATVITWLGSQMGGGCLSDDVAEEYEDGDESPTYAVSVFDIAKEINKWAVNHRCVSAG